MIYYSLKKAVTLNNYIPKEDTTQVINGVVHRVDIEISSDLHTSVLPLSMIIEEPVLSSFVPVEDLTKDQVLSWVTSNFTEQDEANWERVMAEQDSENVVTESVIFNEEA